jgi:hypothetical protein
MTQSLAFRISGVLCNCLGLQWRCFFNFSDSLCSLVLTEPQYVF